MGIDRLHDQLAAYLASYNTGLLSVPGAAPQPVRYRSRDLAVECLLPRWADLAYALGHQPTALLVVPAPLDIMRWLQYEGDPQIAIAPDWSGLLPASELRQAHEHYLVVGLRPRRLDLFDGRRGWGARETLDLADQESEWEPCLKRKA